MLRIFPDGSGYSWSRNNIAVLLSLRLRRSAFRSWPTFPLAIRIRFASVTSRSGTTGKKRGCVRSSIVDEASGWRSMLFGVNTTSGLRQGPALAGRACGNTATHSTAGNSGLPHTDRTNPLWCSKSVVFLRSERVKSNANEARLLDCKSLRNRVESTIFITARISWQVC